MKRLSLIFLSVVLSIATMYAVETADAFLGRVAAKFKSSPSVKATYALTADGVSQRGSLTVAGDCFNVSAPGMESWFDGKTQWTYSSRIGEVNITEPTPEEIGQINPFSIVGAFRKGYKAEFLPSPSGVKKIQMTSQIPGADIMSVQLTVNEKSLHPTEIVLTLSSRQVVVITIDSVKEGGRLPASSFKFDKTRYPGVEVVDLR